MPLRNTTNRLYQKVANSIARDISARKFTTGQRLPAERDLAQRFDVSRPTVREAIIALEIIGLVEVRKGSGVYVRDGAGDKGELARLDIGPFELMEARTLIEGEIAGLAAQLITDEQLDVLEAILDEMQLENQSEATGEMADREFHLTIARVTKNSAIVSVLENLWDFRYHSPLCVRLMNQVREGGVKPIIDEHRAIVDALHSRDPARAKAAMRNHLSRTTDNLLAATEVDAMQKVREEVAKQRQRYVDRTTPE